MLSQQKVDENEEELRVAIQNLSDENRRVFYKSVKTKVKDPDTYAALNWFFITGIHHFYLGKWMMGFVDLTVLIIGVILMFSGEVEIGLIMIIVISITEFWALFRAQLIVQDWNNKIQWKLIKHLSIDKVS